MENNFVKTPYFEFYVYHVFKVKGSDNFSMRAFKVMATGHLPAKELAGKDKNSMHELIEKNRLTCYFYCSKRFSNQAFYDVEKTCEFKGEMVITKEQHDYFDTHRQIGI